jgi:hypothetical protein
VNLNIAEFGSFLEWINAQVGYDVVQRVGWATRNRSTKRQRKKREGLSCVSARSPFWAPASGAERPGE